MIGGKRNKNCILWKASRRARRSTNSGNRMDFPVLGLTSFDGRQRWVERNKGVYTRKGGGRRGWKGEGDDSVHGAWVWWNRVENKSVQFPGDTLSVSGRHPRFSLSFLVVGEREREREGNFYSRNGAILNIWRIKTNSTGIYCFSDFELSITVRFNR